MTINSCQILYNFVVKIQEILINYINVLKQQYFKEFKNSLYQQWDYLLVKWNSDIAAATEAFKLDVLPLRGILNK